MSLSFDEETAKKLHKLLQDLARFTALYEQEESKLDSKKDEIQKSLETFQNQMQEQIQDISEIMSETGAARWRIEAQNILTQGEQHLEAMRECCNAFQQRAEDVNAHFENLSLDTEKRITKALHVLGEENNQVVEDFKRQATDSFEYVAGIANNAAKTIKKAVALFRLDRIGIAVAAALVASLMTSAYINAEWPWESNSRVIQERQVGRDVLTTWPMLSKSEQGEISKAFGLHLPT